MGIDIWVDDIRPAPKGWLHVTNFKEATHALWRFQGNIDNMSFDHDLGECSDCTASHNEDQVGFTPRNKCNCLCHRTGHDIINWMEEFGIWPTNTPTVHSSNAVGRQNIQSVIDKHYNR